MVNISFITNSSLSNGAIIVSVLTALTGLIALFVNYIKHNKYSHNNEQARVIRWLERKLRDTDGNLKSLTIEHDLLEKKYYDQVRVITLLETSKFNVPFSYWLKNINFEIDFVSNHYEKEFNVSLSDLIGKNDYELFDKDTADKYRNNDNKLLLSNKDVLIDIDNEVDSYLVIKWKRYSNNIVIGVAGLAIKLDDYNKEKLINLINELK